LVKICLPKPHIVQLTCSLLTGSWKKQILPRYNSS